MSYNANEQARQQEYHTLLFTIVYAWSTTTYMYKNRQTYTVIHGLFRSMYLHTRFVVSTSCHQLNGIYEQAGDLLFFFFFFFFFFFVRIYQLHLINVSIPLSSAFKFNIESAIYSWYLAFVDNSTRQFSHSYLHQLVFIVRHWCCTIVHGGGLLLWKWHFSKPRNYFIRPRYKWNGILFSYCFSSRWKNKIKNSGSAESHTRTYAHTAVELVENCDCQLEYPQNCGRFNL